MLTLNLHNKQAELRIDNHPFQSLFEGGAGGGYRGGSVRQPAPPGRPLGPPGQAPSKAGAGWDEIRSMQGREDRYDDIPDGWNHDFDEEKKFDQPKEKVSGADFFDKEKARSKTTKKTDDDFEWGDHSKPMDTPGFTGDGAFDFDFEKSHSTPVDQPATGGGLLDLEPAQP